MPCLRCGLPTLLANMHLHRRTLNSVGFAYISLVVVAPFFLYVLLKAFRLATWNMAMLNGFIYLAGVLVGASRVVVAVEIFRDRFTVRRVLGRKTYLLNNVRCITPDMVEQFGGGSIESVRVDFVKGKPLQLTGFAHRCQPLYDDLLRALQQMPPA